MGGGVEKGKKKKKKREVKMAAEQTVGMGVGGEIPRWFIRYYLTTKDKQLDII